MAEKAQTEADTSDSGVFPGPSSSTPHRRPGHSGVHRHHKSRHRGGSQDFSGNASSHHPHHQHPSPHRGGAYQPTSDVPAASHSTVLSRPFYENVSDDEYHHGGRRHHGRPRHRSESHPHGGPHRHSGSRHPNKAAHHRGFPKESHYDGEADAHDGSHHPDAHHHRGPLRHGETYSRPSHVGFYHHGTPHHPIEHHHHHHRGHRKRRPGTHRHDDGHSDHHYEEYHHASSRVFGPHRPRSAARVDPAPPHAAAPHPPAARTRTHSSGAAHSRTSRSPNKVHPQESSPQSSESLPEDERVQKHKPGRAQRAHKRQHSVHLFGRLWDTVSCLFHGLREMLRKLTESLVFEAFIFLVVCLNTIMLVAQTFTGVEVRGGWFFMAFDSIFLCIYMVEAMLKIIALGSDYFSDPWNNLDFFIMIMAVLDFVLAQISNRSFKRTGYNQDAFRRNTYNQRLFKVFKSLRALRAIRVLRRISFLTSLQEVTATLERSLPSITTILILMFTCLPLFRQSDPKRFQSIFTTIFTLFTLLTLDDWSLIYLDSQAQGTWYIILILMIYIIIQYFIFLNLVIAVLVDNFQMALLGALEKVKQERAAQTPELLLDASLTELDKEEPKEVMSEHAKQKYLIEKKFGTMTEKQQELRFHFLQLATGVEHYQQKFRSMASVIDEIVDTTFEAGEQDFRK